MFDFWKNFGFVRLQHAAPDAPAVDVYANNKKVASNLAFKELTGYLRIPSGRYKIEVYPAGKKKNPVFKEIVYIRPNSVATAAVIGKLNNLDLLLVNDPEQRARRDKAYLRVAHLSPNAPGGDVKLDSRTLFRNVNYKEVTNYLQVEPGTYDLNIYRSGTDNQVLEVANLVLQPGFYYTTAVVGLVNAKPKLQTLVYLDGLYRPV